MDVPLSLFPLLTHVVPVVGAALLGVLLAPWLRWKRLTAASVAVLVALFFDALLGGSHFTAVGASPWRWLVLLPPVAVWLAPWFLIPFKLYRSTLPRAEERLEPFDPVRHPLSEPAVAWVRETVAALVAEGFVPLDDVWKPFSAERGVRTVLMDHASEGTRAMLTAGARMIGGIPNDHLTLVTLLADGRQVVVENSREPRAHPRRRNLVGLRLPDVREVGGLLAAFRAFARRTAGGQPRSLPPESDARTYFEALDREFEDEMVARGWYLRAAERRRWSLRAACLSGWYALFPLRQLRLDAGRRNQDRTLRRLGLPIPRREPDPHPVSWWLSFGGTQALPAAAMLAFGVAWPWLAGPGGPGALFLSAAFRADTVVPERLPAGFTVPADFPGAVAALERLVGAPARPLTADDGFSGTPTDAMRVPVAKRRVDGLLAAAQPAFLAQGFVLFHTQEFDGVHGEPEALALFRSRDPLDAVAKVNTNGGNYGIDTPEVAKWLRKVAREHPFTLTAAGFDYVEGRFDRPLSAGEAQALAARVASFCPDVVAQGTGSVPALAREMQRTRTLYCWWD